MSISRPSVISLFSGAGGYTLGYKLGGFNELLGIDIDETACNTFQHNFPLTPVWNRDISSVEIEEILQQIELETGQTVEIISSKTKVMKQQWSHLRALLKQTSRLLIEEN